MAKVSAVPYINSGVAPKQCRKSPYDDRAVLSEPLHDNYSGDFQDSRPLRAIDLKMTPFSRWLVGMRFKVQARLNALARMPPGNAETDSDASNAIAHISVAMCLLKQANLLTVAAVYRDDYFLVADGFSLAMRTMMGLMDDRYFSKGTAELVFGYGECIGAIEGCRQFFCFEPLGFGDAASAYKPYILSQMERIRQKCRNPGVFTAILARRISRLF
jgi:hypothetical protein